MIVSILIFLNSLSLGSLPRNINIPKSNFHHVSRRIFLKNNYRSSLTKKTSIENYKRITTPWNGHFSAKNFRKNSAKLKNIKKTLRQIIINLPQWHTQALKDLEIRKERHISRGLSNSKKIILNTDSIQNPQELIAVFVHEVGHIVDLGALSGHNGQKTRFWDGQTPILSDDLSLKFYQISWKTASKQKQSANNRDFVSGYAQSDCFEDFAETYLFYRLHGEKFRGILHNSPALKEKYEFMKKYIFQNQEFSTNKASRYNFNYQNVFDATLLTFNKIS